MISCHVIRCKMLQICSISLLTPCINKFAQGKDVSLFPPGKRYKDIFAESELVVMDYSFITFDFTYLRELVYISALITKNLLVVYIRCVPWYILCQDDSFGEMHGA